MYKLVIKPILDFIVSLVAFIFLFPIFLLATIAIKLEDGGPTFYTQVRTGKYGKNFKMYKFRSMKVETEVKGKRFTKVGKFLRKTSIDELPQLLNVLKGQMSLIGPRAWIPEYYENFTEEQKHRCDVLPGITGLAQARGRNGLTIFQKLAYDLEYSKNLNFLMDLRVVFETIVIVFKRDNAEIIQEDIQNEINLLKEQKKR